MESELQNVLGVPFSGEEVYFNLTKEGWVEVDPMILRKGALDHVMHPGSASLQEVQPM